MALPLANEAETDRRYRVLVHLRRSDMPQTWTFHCPRCTMKVCEIVNAEVVSMTDLFDQPTFDSASSGWRCDGRYNGGKCGIWYYMDLG